MDDQKPSPAPLDPPPRPGLLTRLLAMVRTRRFAILSSAFVAGILFWGAFNTAMEWTTREEFCISCHEMRDNVYAEYRNTIHFQNRTGVRATCPDCLEITAWTDDGEIMGVRHKTLPIEGVQFHPESILTEHGHALLRNFLEQAQ